MPLLQRFALPILLVALLVGIVLLRVNRQTVSLSAARRAGATASCTAARRDFRTHTGNVWVTVSARVVKVLPDELGRYRHQRFIVRCRAGQTLLIVNNIDLGSRVPAAPAQPVVVHGQYVWDSLGGLVHFTHHDPEGGSGGWILYRAKVYALSSFHRSAPGVG